MKKIFAITTVVATLALSACSSYRPIAAASGEVGAKRGEATAATLFGFIPLSVNNSMLKAAENGGIKHVGTVDQKYFSFLGIYSSVTTIVTGD